MKKIFLSLLVVATAVSMSAFTNASTKQNQRVNQWFYTLNQAGTTYTRVGMDEPDPQDCIPKDQPSCIISFSQDEGSAVNASALPATLNYQSSTHGYVAN